MGWEALREQIFANQQRQGVLPPNAVLTPWPEQLPRWASLTDDQRRLFIRQVEVYAAFLAYTDHEIGRVIQAVEDAGQIDNTLIIYIYISGDNGASSEGQLNGTPNEVAYFNAIETPVARQLELLDVWGSDRTYNHMAAGWAWAFSTPYRWVKQVGSHFGGTRNGMAISWPRRIADRGAIRHQFHHVIDVVPTILEAIGIPEPNMVNGVPQRPIEGVSMAYTFDAANAQAPTRRRTQHFEMFGHRGIYHDGWYANTTPSNPPWDSAAQPPADVVNGYAWELYNLAEDPTQSRNLAAQHPERLRNLQQLYLMEATRFGVLPMDNSTVLRLLVQRPGFAAGRTEFNYSGTGVGLTSDSAPPILNRAYRVTAEIEVPTGGAHGVLAAQGGRFGGFGFYLREGRSVWTWNLLDIERIKWEGAEPLPPGRHSITFEWRPDAAGPPIGRGGVGTLSVNGRQVAERRMERSIPIYMQWDEPFEVGQDTGTPVDDREYQVPFAFTGTLRNLRFTLGESTIPARN